MLKSNCQVMFDEIMKGNIAGIFKEIWWYLLVCPDVLFWNGQMVVRDYLSARGLHDTKENYYQMSNYCHLVTSCLNIGRTTFN